MHPHLLACTIIALSLASCDARQDQAQLRPAPSQPAANPAPMSQPAAIIISWVGPSDRPNPPTIFWADKAALDGASNWIMQRDKFSIKPTPVEAATAALVCMAKATPAASTSGQLIEVIAWDGASSAPVRLNEASSTQFLAAAIGCVGDASPAAGYLRSLQTLVKNASP